MCLGKPVLACPVGGLSNIIDNSCGKLCRGEEELIQAAYNLLNDTAKYALKSKGALKRSKLFTNVDNYCIQIEQVYKKAFKTF
jgi:glycosyltransferase involved in cell wall biosynthesis